MIIGVVDGGVWPENPPYSDRARNSPNGKLVYRQVPGWHGRCVPGEAFNASNCNQKLIGARYYNEGFGGNAGIDAMLPWSSTRRATTAVTARIPSSTAGGNANVTTTGPAAVFGSVSGIAPRARIASYKACWSIPGTAGSCPTVDTLAAIDQAVADGVDVINYSISGTLTNFRDPVEIAFLFAADAGIFVAASAGNSGPPRRTVAHPEPVDHDRCRRHAQPQRRWLGYAGQRHHLQRRLRGHAVGPRTARQRRSRRSARRRRDRLGLCFAAVDNGGVAVLDPAMVAGKIVVCERGVIARVNKSLAVQQAGGVGMILVNPTPPTRSTPTSTSCRRCIWPYPTGAAVKAYAATAGATATINQATIITTNLPPSRPPSRPADRCWPAAGTC